MYELGDTFIIQISIIHAWTHQPFQVHTALTAQLTQNDIRPETNV